MHLASGRHLPPSIVLRKLLTDHTLDEFANFVIILLLLLLLLLELWLDIPDTTLALNYVDV